MVIRPLDSIDSYIYLFISIYPLYDQPGVINLSDVMGYDVSPNPLPKYVSSIKPETVLGIYTTPNKVQTSSILDTIDSI